MSRYVTEYWGGFHDYESMVAALPAAVQDENEKHGTTVTVEEARNNILDYVPPENHFRDRRFPNLAMAQNWSAQFIGRDFFGCVEARVIERDTKYGTTEDLAVWHFAGEGWYRADE